MAQTQLTNELWIFFLLAPIDYPPWFMSNIKLILNTNILAPSKSLVHFDLLSKAILHNTKLLTKIDYSVKKLINTFLSSELSYGSEFRPAPILKLLLQYRKNLDWIEAFLIRRFTASNTI